jgi:hypothetical protein
VDNHQNLFAFSLAKPMGKRGTRTAIPASRVGGSAFGAQASSDKTINQKSRFFNEGSYFGE